MGTMPTAPLGGRYDGSEIDKLASINPYGNDSVTVSMISEVQASKPLLTPPPVAENALYAAVEPAAPDNENASPSNGFQYHLSPGELWTYKVQAENIAVRPTGNLVLHRVEGARTLLVKTIEPDGLMHIVNMTQEKLIIRVGSPSEAEIPLANIGLMFIKRDGRLEFVPSGLPERDRDKYLKQIDPKIDPPASPLPISVGSNFLVSATTPYFVPFPAQLLKRGDVWNEKKAKYTVVGFETVNGYNCMLLDYEQEISSAKKEIARIACDTQSGMVVKLDAEIQMLKHAQQGNPPTEEKEHVTVELIRKEQLTPAELELERQAINSINWALLEHYWVELDALRQKLEKVKEQYPAIRLMPGLVGMIADVNQQIASRAKDVQYTYRDHLHTLAMLLTMQWENTGKYSRFPKYSFGVSPELEKAMPKPVILEPRTPFYEYEVIDVEGTGKAAKCKIIARGKKGTPAEGEAWVKTLSASEGASEIQPFQE
jgi:hypothetical protein